MRIDFGFTNTRHTFDLLPVECCFWGCESGRTRFGFLNRPSNASIVAADACSMSFQTDRSIARRCRIRCVAGPHGRNRQTLRRLGKHWSAKFASNATQSKRHRRIAENSHLACVVIPETPNRQLQIFCASRGEAPAPLNRRNAETQKRRIAESHQRSTEGRDSEIQRSEHRENQRPNRRMTEG